MARLSSSHTSSSCGSSISDLADELLHRILLDVRLPLQDGQFLNSLMVCRRWLPIAREVLYHSLNLWDNRIVEFHRMFFSTKPGVIWDSSKGASPLRLARKLKIVV